MRKALILRATEIEQKCGGCPTIYDFVDEETGHRMYFRLRHGGARLANETTGETIISGSMPDHDGVCNWSDVVEWAKTLGLIIIS